MDKYLDKNDLNLMPIENIETKDLLFFLIPCSSCSRNQFREHCYMSCRNYEMWKELLKRTNIENTGEDNEEKENNF